MDKMPDVALIKVQTVNLLEQAKVLNVSDTKTEKKAEQILFKVKNIISEADEQIKSEADKVKKRFWERIKQYAVVADNIATKTLGQYTNARQTASDEATELEQKRAEAYARIEGKREQQTAIRAKDSK